MSWDEPTVPCPYCGEPVERTMRQANAHLLGEHCWTCHLPFDVDYTTGEAIGQDDPRFGTDTRP